MLGERFRLDKFIKRRYQSVSLPLVQEQLADWFDGAFGQQLFDMQKMRCERALSQYFAYRIAQMGLSPRHGLLENLQPRHKVLFSRNFSGASCQCEFDALPLPSDTIDIALLHHVLDFSLNPHQSLIEAARVITAGGHMVIIGFNPLSAFGLYKWLGVLWSRDVIWRHNSLRRGRITDWLQLLGFQVTEVVGREYTFDFKQTGWWSQFGLQKLLSSGAFYMIVAQKTVTPVTPVKLRHWSPLRMPSIAKAQQNKTSAKQTKKTD